MDGDFTAFPDGAVAVTGDRIAAVGPMADAAGVLAAEVVDARGGIVLPGFVNTHCHAAMVLFRGLADDRPLDGFLKAVWAAEAGACDARNGPGGGCGRAGRRPALAGLPM